MARMVIDGFGQVELNNVAFRRDGRIEAQCALDTAAFTENVPCENGMVLRVKKAEHKITFADASAANQLYALNYTSEHMYDERKHNLDEFINEAGVAARGYRLRDRNMFGLTAEGFVGGTAPALNAAVGVGILCYG